MINSQRMIYLSEPYPHWLIRMTSLGLPLAAEQLLSEALLDDRVSIWGREKDKSLTANVYSSVQ